MPLSIEEDTPHNDVEEWGHPTAEELEQLGLACCLRFALRMANRSLWTARLPAGDTQN